MSFSTETDWNSTFMRLLIPNLWLLSQFIGADKTWTLLLLLQLHLSSIAADFTQSVWFWFVLFPHCFTQSLPLWRVASCSFLSSHCFESKIPPSSSSFWSVRVQLFSSSSSSSLVSWRVNQRHDSSPPRYQHSEVHCSFSTMRQIKTEPMDF